MSVSDAQYEEWLADIDSVRVLLAELDYSGGTAYVATAPFISTPNDSDPNRVYDDILEEAVDATTRIDGLVSFGEVGLINDGELNPWIDRAWNGWPIRLYLGDPTWSRDDFRLWARGVNGGISTAQIGRLAFRMLDTSAGLDVEIDTGDLPNENGPIPLALGSVYNAPAFLLQPAPYEFKASFLPVLELTPKDNGNPIPHTDNLSNGSFEIPSGLVGTLTVDIEEQNNTPALVAQWVANEYGVVIDTIDLPDYTVGLYYKNRVSGRKILDDLCEGIGAYWYINRVGEMVIRQQTVPTEASAVILGDDIAQDQVRLTETQSPWRDYSLQYKQNHNTLTTVADTVNDTEAERLKRQWQEDRQRQSVDDYPLAESVTRPSVLQSQADAATEVARVLSIRSVRRDIWSIETFTPQVNEGDAVTVEVDLMAGKVGRVISIARSPTRGETSLEVWI